MPISTAVPRLQSGGNDPTGGLLPEFANPGDAINIDDFGTAKWNDDIANFDKATAKKNAALNQTVDVPTRNPLATSIYKNSLQGATDYSKNIKDYSDSLYNTAAGTASRNLGDTTRGIRSSYNSRGLLNSGMEQGAEAGAAATAGQNLINTRSQINQGLLTGLQGMQANAFGNAATLAQPGTQTAQTQLQGIASNIGTQTDNSALANAIWGQVGKGAGALGGLGIAGAFSPSTDYSKIYEDVYMNGK